MERTHAVCEDLARLGEVCARMGSAFFGAILQRAAEAYGRDETLAGLLDRHAHRSRLGLRLGGAAHFRALRAAAPEIAAHYPSTGGDGDVERAWNAVLADIHANTAQYDQLFARPVQTNEVARSMPVLGAMLTLSHATQLPLRVFEIGSSAGLVLNFDRYRYSGEGWSWGSAFSPVRLRNHTVSGVPAHLDAPLKVVERRGSDLHPLDAADEDDADTLLGFIWPDQQERFERLRAALAVAREHPVDIVETDGVAWARENARPREGAATAVLHTVITEHMPPEVRARLREAIDELAGCATGTAPFAWVRMEIAGKGYETRVTRWPGEFETHVATSDGHAQNLTWLGAPGELRHT